MIGWNYQRYWDSPEVEGDYEIGHSLHSHEKLITLLVYINWLCALFLDNGMQLYVMISIQTHIHSFNSVIVFSCNNINH